MKACQFSKGCLGMCVLGKEAGGGLTDNLNMNLSESD